MYLSRIIYQLMTTMKRMCNDSTGVFGECSSAKRTKTSDLPQSTPFSTTLVNWAHLPDIIIHEIFDKLNFNDRTNASSVCKHWRRNAYHWRWWKHITFTIEPYSIEKARYFIAAFGKIVSYASIKLNTLSIECMEEFVSLIQILSENRNLKSLMIEPSHCRFEFLPIEQGERNDHSRIVRSITACLPKLNKFSIGCIEDLSNEIENFLKILSGKNSKHVKILGLASVKDEPGICRGFALKPTFIKPFSGLEILSVDYDELCDEFLNNLQVTRNLKRLVVHLHSIRPEHPGTSNETWKEFKKTHPFCELRLTLIHAFKDVNNLHVNVLRKQMPLSHLKVFFCESVNITVLERLSENYCETLRSLIWVDSLSQSEDSWAIATRNETPDPFLMISWLCKNLEEVIFHGYKYREENLIAVARLRGSRLRRLEIAEDDILFAPHENCMKDVSLSLKRAWAPLRKSELHPVICNPTAGDSDEYLLPIVLADLQ